MCVCVYDVCMYVCMYVRICLCMHACMYVCMHACMYICIHACMYVCVCMYVCMCVCVYVCMSCMYVHRHWCLQLHSDEEERLAFPSSASFTQALKTTRRKRANLHWRIPSIIWSCSHFATMGHALQNNSWSIMDDDNTRNLDTNLGQNYDKHTQVWLGGPGGTTPW